MSTRPANGCQKRKPCAHDGNSASGMIMPDSAFTNMGARLEARRVFSATTAQSSSTVKADDKKTVSVIETIKRTAALRSAGGSQDQSCNPNRGRAIPATQNIGSARKLVFATRQAMARISQREC